MNEAAERTARIEDLDRVRLRGQNAQRQMDELGELLANKQQEYVSEMLMYARKPETPEGLIVRCALKMASVTEVLEDLADDIGRGNVAGRQLAEMTQQPEDDV